MTSVQHDRCAGTGLPRKRNGSPRNMQVGWEENVSISMRMASKKLCAKDQLLTYILLIWHSVSTLGSTKVCDCFYDVILLRVRQFREYWE
jgi:hypothetical protein